MLNGTNLSLEQTPKRDRSSNSASAALMKLKSLPPPVRLGLWLTLLVLAASLAGCATTSAPSSFTPRNPSPPQPSQSQPSVPYSSSAAVNINHWRKLLTDTLAMP